MDWLDDRSQGETLRLARLHALQILDTAPEQQFDSLTAAAAECCDMPVAMLNFVDDDRQWSKSVVGLDHEPDMARCDTICTHVVVDGAELLEIADLTLDARFRDIPLVAAAPKLRFYAGVPLILPGGARVGALCVLDVVPRCLTTRQRTLLARLADAVVHALVAREGSLDAVAGMRLAQLRTERLYAKAPALLQITDGHGRVVSVSDRWLAELGYDREEVLGRPARAFLAACEAPDDAAEATGPAAAAARQDGERRMIRKDGSVVDLLLSSITEPDDETAHTITIMQNLTVEHATRAALAAARGFLERTGAVAGIGGWEFDVGSERVAWSDQTSRLHDCPPGHQPTFEEAVGYYTPESRRIVLEALDQAMQDGTPWDLELQLVSAHGRPFWARIVGAVEFLDGVATRVTGATQDITSRKNLEFELAESRELLQVTLDSIGDAVITTDVRGRVTWMNAVAERLTGWPKLDAEGQPLPRVFTVLHETSRVPIPDPVAACLRLGMPVYLPADTILVCRTGAEHAIMDSAAPIRGACGQIFGAVLVFHDVSEQRRQQRDMEFRATHDSLTGVANRASFEHRLDALLAKADPRTRRSHVLLFIDLDQFKVVNDTYGHSTGDGLLQQVSVMLRDCVRSGDTVARLGGDEFGVILENCSRAQGERIAERIRAQVDQHCVHQEQRRLRTGTSIGLVVFDGNGSDRALLLKAADAACYSAKQAGRNCVHAWSDEEQLTNVHFRDMQWVARLGQALEEDQFELYGQRIEALSESGPGVLCEVLLRLREPDGSLILPGAFVLAAERFHMAARIDRWVVARVFRWMAERNGIAEPILLSVNLSGQSISDRSFHRDLAALIRSATFDVGRLCFEVTETAAVTRLADAKAFIDEIRALGVKVALDDFGSGASSFGYLKTLPVDFIKIDGQFIKDISQDPLDVATVRCFREVASSIAVKTIAECIEHAEQRQALVELGIDFGQGYLMHRPEPLDLAIDAIRATAGP